MSEPGVSGLGSLFPALVHGLVGQVVLRPMGDVSRGPDFLQSQPRCNCSCKMSTSGEHLLEKVFVLGEIVPTSVVLYYWVCSL